MHILETVLPAACCGPEWPPWGGIQRRVLVEYLLKVSRQNIRGPTRLPVS